MAHRTDRFRVDMPCDLDSCGLRRICLLDQADGEASGLCVVGLGVQGRADPRDH
jgi:hypothetical protein